MGIRNNGARSGNPFSFQPKVPPLPLPSRFVWSYPLGSPELHEAITKAQKTFARGDIRAFGKPGTPSAPKLGGKVTVFAKESRVAEIIANRIREEIDRAHCLRGKFMVAKVEREANATDVRSMGTENIIVAVYGRIGGDVKALALFNAGTVRFNVSGMKELAKNKFSNGGGITLGHLAIVADQPASPLGRDDLDNRLMGNIGAHEFGHAISYNKGEPQKDHVTGGLMKDGLSPDDPVLHFTSKFLRQFECLNLNSSHRF